MKIAIICPEFQKSNIRKLPWKYIYEIAKYLGKDHIIKIITDSDKKDVDELNIVSVNRLFRPLKGETDELLHIIKQENPDKCIMLLGLSSFLRKEFKINKSVIGIFTSPLYSLRELIKNMGIKNSYKYRKYTVIHYVNALIPNYFIRKWEGNFEKIIFLSNDTCKKLVKKGLSPEKALFVPPGLDEEFLVMPQLEEINEIKSIINPKNVPIIMYFTSPLTLRGTDILVEAFAKVRKKMSCKLVFLSRLDYNELLMEEEILNRIAEKNDINDSIEIISKYLSPKQLKEYLSTASIICLPFKIVISDIPVSVLESMALGKPVISTNVACIPDIMKGNGIIVNANDSEDLANSILQLLDNEDLVKKMGIKSRNYMEKYPNWIQVGESLVKIIED